MENKLVYIASPYSNGDNFVNVQAQITMANTLLDMGFCVIAPLAHSCLINMQEYRSYDVWMREDYMLLSKCDCLLRLDGESKGADLEVKYAEEHNIPVFYSINKLILSLKSENKEKAIDIVEDK